MSTDEMSPKIKILSILVLTLLAVLITGVPIVLSKAGIVCQRGYTGACLWHVFMETLWRNFLICPLTVMAVFFAGWNSRLIMLSSMSADVALIGIEIASWSNDVPAMELSFGVTLLLLPILFVTGLFGGLERRQAAPDLPAHQTGPRKR